MNGSAIFFIAAAVAQGILAASFYLPQAPTAQWVEDRLGLRPIEAAGFVAATILFNVSIVTGANLNGKAMAAAGLAMILLLVLLACGGTFLLALGHRRLNPARSASRS
jgi:hypothetical protein